MSKSPRFNYIITIHNKEDMIEQVIMSVLMCCRDNSHVYPVIDGCTDKTEEIIDRIIATYSGVPITKVHTADVHELLSINAGLRAANQDGDGYNIILQDDVILADFMLEQKVVALYEWGGPKLGYVSFRLGANFIEDFIKSDTTIPLKDFVENAYGHGCPEVSIIYPGQFTYRDVPIKSPVCMPFYLTRSIGFLEERLAPYAHDDTEYSIRCKKNGFQNAVFAVRFYSEIKWGGTRENPHPKIGEIQKRNIKKIREWYRELFAEMKFSSMSTEIINVKCDAFEKAHALDYLNKVKQNFDRYSKKNTLYNIKSIIKRTLNVLAK